MVVCKCEELWMVVYKCEELWMVVYKCEELWMVACKCEKLWMVVYKCDELWMVVYKCEELWMVVCKCKKNSWSDSSIDQTVYTQLVDGSKPIRSNYPNEKMLSMGENRTATNSRLPS